MKFKLQAFLSVLLLASAARAVAAVPAGIHAGKIPDIIVWDEADVQHSLWDELRTAGTGPVIVLPVYTRCTMSCPVLARMLVQQSSKLRNAAPYRVLIFSFDAGDDAQALRQFRAREKLPPSWILVRSGTLDIRRFCDFFHYPVLTEGTVMIHANQIFLLNHSLEWKTTFVDQRWDGAELGTWMSRVESHTLWSWLAVNPELIVFAGFAGLLISLVLIVSGLIFGTRPRFRGPGPSARTSNEAL